MSPVLYKDKIKGRSWKKSPRINDLKLPQFGKRQSLQILEAKQISNKRNPKKDTPRHIIVTLLKMMTNKNFKEQWGNK